MTYNSMPKTCLTSSSTAWFFDSNGSTYAFPVTDYTELWKPSKGLEKYERRSTDSKYLLKQVYEWMKLDNFRVVYGGRHTVLLYKKTGKRVCQVTRDEEDSNSLTRAVLYLVLKFKGLGGKQINEWASRFINLSTLRMKAEFDVEFLRWLLEYGKKAHYTRSESKDILNKVYFHRCEGNRFDSFLYFLCEDQFGIKEEEINELISSATCSCKKHKGEPEAVSMKDLTEGKVNSLDLKVDPIMPNDSELYSEESLETLTEISEYLKTILQVYRSASKE